MEYTVFRNKLREVFAQCGAWNVTFDWKEEDGNGELDTMELELDRGPVYDLRIISVRGFYDLYQKKGWEEILKEMENRPAPVRRRKGENYALLMNADGNALFEQLRLLRASIARENHIPPYVVFTNRTLFEMVKMLPVNEEQLRELYGVGERNCSEYGEEFLSKIRECTGGVFKEMLCV